MQAFNLKKKQLYKNRILWRANQNNLFEKRCKKFEDLSESEQNIIFSKIDHDVDPILIFKKDYQNWTILTHSEVISYHESQIHIANLDSINKKMSALVASGEHATNETKFSASLISLDDLNTIIWAPEGKELFSLMNILQMFPLGEG